MPGERLIFTHLLAAAAAITAQLPQATVAGSVVDAERGQPLAGAVVSLPDLDRAVVTDARGGYTFRDVPPGPQHLVVRLIGYAPRMLHALVPPEGALRISIALSPLAVRLASVKIRSSVALRGVERHDAPPFADRAMTIGAVRNHPLLAEPDVLEALGGGEVAMSPEAPSGVHLRGSAADQTAYLLDGIPIFNPYHAAGMFASWNPDAISALRVWSTTPSPDYALVLGGAIEAVTRTPGVRSAGRGSASVTQTRLTVDGPLPGGAGYLVSARAGYPGFVAQASDASHIIGQSGDRLVKFDGMLAGGRTRLLYYDSENEVSSAADVAPARNAFEWESRSAGVDWSRELGAMTLTVRGWSAASASDALWRPDSSPVVHLESTRSDAAIFAALEHSTGGSASLLAVRLERSRTSLVTRDSPGSSDALRASTTLPSVILRHRRTFGSGITVQADGAVIRRGRRPLASTEMAVRWTPAARLDVTAAVARRHQFVHSLRNDESVVSGVFPADLFIGHGAPGVPIATSRQAVIAFAFRPRAQVRLALQGYLRHAGGLLLAAPSTDRPFAVDGFAVARGVSRGASAEAAVTGARYAALVSYGWQRTRLRAGAQEYSPVYAASHRVDGGVIVFPAPTWSLRLGATAIAGRRSTPMRGVVEWESCNLLDLGCEFGGSAPVDSGALGTLHLPAYLRVDVGARKHWHVRIGGRDVPIALFGTVTNVIGRANVLAYATNPMTGAREPIEMRPMAPLVIGIDWQF